MEMSWQDSSETQFTFHDASAYFTDEEWKLLQEWQKELYRNVMKEIHQALISLGPLIATTVCSARAKEKEDLCAMDNHCPERRHKINHSLKPPHDIGSRKEVAPVPIFINDLGAEMEESSTDQKSGCEVVPFCIKDEADTYCVDRRGHKGKECDSSLIGGDTMNRGPEVENSLNYTRNEAADKSSSRRANMTTAQSYNNGTRLGSNLWLENHELGVESTQCGIGVSDSAHLSFHQEALTLNNVEINYWTGDRCPEDLYVRPPHIEKNNLSINSFSKCEKTSGKKDYLIRQKRTYVEERPYQCNECEKSFRKKDNLFVHKRIHTGERPYHCTICEKSFSQKGILDRHMITHIGERPFQCSLCEKTFKQYRTLIVHQKTHNRPKHI